MNEAHAVQMTARNSLDAAKWNSLVSAVGELPGLRRRLIAGFQTSTEDHDKLKALELLSPTLRTCADTEPFPQARSAPANNVHQRVRLALIPGHGYKAVWWESRFKAQVVLTNDLA